MLRTLFILVVSWTFLLSSVVYAEPVGDDIATVKKVAEPLLDNVLKAMEAGDFAAYTRNFDETMRKVSDEADFKRANAIIKMLMGSYQSRELLGFLTQKQLTIVLWKARYSDTKDDVLVRLVLSKNDDKIEISGLWMQ
jgi:hypothetical protein